MIYEMTYAPCDEIVYYQNYYYQSIQLDDLYDKNVQCMFMFSEVGQNENPCLTMFLLLW